MTALLPIRKMTSRLLCEALISTTDGEMDKLPEEVRNVVKAAKDAMNGAAAPILAKMLQGMVDRKFLKQVLKLGGLEMIQTATHQYNNALQIGVSLGWRMAQLAVKDVETPEKTEAMVKELTEQANVDMIRAQAIIEKHGGSTGEGW